MGEVKDAGGSVDDSPGYACEGIEAGSAEAVNQ